MPAVLQITIGNHGPFVLLFIKHVLKDSVLDFVGIETVVFCIKCLLVFAVHANHQCDLFIGVCVGKVRKENKVEAFAFACVLIKIIAPFRG